MEDRKGNKTPSLAASLATEASKGDTHKSQFEARIKRYGKAKNNSLANAEYIICKSPLHDMPEGKEKEHEKLINFEHKRLSKLHYRLADCGSYLVFNNYFTVGEIRLSKAKFCMKHLLCQLCAIRRGSKILSRYVTRFEEIVAETPVLKPYLVTLTVKDGADLAERFKHLQKSLVTWHKRRHRDNAPCEAKKAYGAAWSYEIKRGKRSGLWHPHVHAVWLCESPPDQLAIQDQWHSITGDSYIVDVRPINPEDPTTGFMEVFKYAVKFSEQEPEDTFHAYETLCGKRLIGSFGSFHGIPEPDELTDDPLEGLPYFEMLYLHSKTWGYFLSDTTVNSFQELTT